MPADFLKCVKNGGKVVTKQLKGGRSIKICYDKKGKSHVSEVKTKKKAKINSKTKENTKKDEKLLENSKVLMKDLIKLKEHFDNNHRIEV